MTSCFGCEVGGFGQGFGAARIDAGEYLRKPFHEGMQYDVTDNYLSVWNLEGDVDGGAAQPVEGDGVGRVSLYGGAEKFSVPTVRDVDAVITRYDVVHPEFGKRHVVVGNMNIRCPGTGIPTIPMRQRAVRLLREKLDGIVGAPDVPVVRIILGDNSLVSEQAREALEQETDEEPVWQVYPS